MREVKPAVIAVSSVVATLLLIAAGFVLLPKLLFLPSERQTRDNEREARALIEQHVNGFAADVVAHSTGPAGPAAADLAKLADQASLRAAPERSAGALTALWVMASERADAALGQHLVRECYQLTFHDLGAPAAGSQIAHLAGCRDVLGRLDAELPKPSASPSR